MFRQSIENFRSLTATAGKLSVQRWAEKRCTHLIRRPGARVPKQLVDMSARSGYALSGARPATRYDMASEYYQFDWEYADSPEHTSWIASSWVSSTACHTTHPIEYFL